jgi:amino acid permease
MPQAEHGGGGSGSGRVAGTGALTSDEAWPIATNVSATAATEEVEYERDPHRGGGNMLLDRRMSETALTLTPVFHSQMRKLQPTHAIFNLVSTIMGGGVLSLPYALSQTGIIAGVTLIVVAAAMSDFSVYLLVAAARRKNCTSYETLAEECGGRKAKLLVITLVFGLTWLCEVGYLLLVGELALEVASGFLEMGNDPEVLNYWRIICTICCTISILPLCFFDKLHALRYTSFISILSVLLLTVSVIVRSVGEGQGFAHPASIKWLPDSFGDVLYGLPFFCVAYLCHFNVLPMHCELRRPTRRRMKRVIHYTMSIPAVLYTLTAVFGYLYALSDTCDSILKNFDRHDPLMLVGRAGLVITLLFSFPLIVLPCRDSLNRLIFEGKSMWSSLGKTRHSRTVMRPANCNDDSDSDEDDSNRNRVSTRDAARGGDVESDMMLDEPLLSGENDIIDLGDDVTIVSTSSSSIDGSAERLKSTLLHSTVHRVVATLGLVGSALVMACAIRTITVVWSFMAIVGITVAFILPSAFYLTGSAKWWFVPRKIAALLLFVWSCVTAVACFYEAVMHMDDQVCVKN